MTYWIWLLIFIVTFSLLITSELLTKEHCWISSAKLLSACNIQWRITSVGTTFYFQNHIFVDRHYVPPSADLKLGGHWREILLSRRNALDPNCSITGGNCFFFFLMILRAVFVYGVGFDLLIFNHIWLRLINFCLFLAFFKLLFLNIVLLVMPSNRVC